MIPRVTTARRLLSCPARTSGACGSCLPLDCQNLGSSVLSDTSRAPLASLPSYSASSTRRCAGVTPDSSQDTCSSSGSGGAACGCARQRWRHLEGGAGRGRAPWGTAEPQRRTMNSPSTRASAADTTASWPSSMSSVQTSPRRWPARTRWPHTVRVWAPRRRRGGAHSTAALGGERTRHLLHGQLRRHEALRLVVGVRVDLVL